VGEKIFGMPNHSREREPCAKPLPPLAHHICNVPRNVAPWHIYIRDVPRAPFPDTLQM